MRFEISNIDEKIVEKIKIYCVKHKITQGKWAELAHKSLSTPKHLTTLNRRDIMNTERS